MAEDVVSHDNASRRKKLSFHDHIVVLDIMLLIGVNENDIEHAVEIRDTIIRTRRNE